MWRKPLIISLLIHGIIFSVLTTIKAPTLKVQEAPPLKAYIVSVASKTKSQPIIEKSINRQEEAPQIRTSKKAIIPAANTIIKIKKRAMPKPTIDTSNYKKIDLKLGLNSILNKQFNTFPLTSQMSQTLTQPQRITVPKEHQKNAIDPLKIEKQSMQFTIYRLGDKCFKKVSIGAGVMPKNDLPDSYMIGIKCAKTKITDAYDQVMSKWLDKK